jgi:hypothetical protein
MRAAVQAGVASFRKGLSAAVPPPEETNPLAAPARDGNGGDRYLSLSLSLSIYLSISLSVTGRIVAMLSSPLQL